MTQHEAEWPQRLTATIARQVQNVRGERRMSAQQLADATAALGHAMPRSVIANLESGRRDTVSVAELLVLARALRVPPLELVFPLGREEMVELLPGETVATWDAARWFTGEAHFPPSPTINEDVQAWRVAATGYFREQDRLFGNWYGNEDLLQRARAENRTTDVEYGERNRQTLADQLRRHRSLMRQEGLNPGELPAGLRHLEEPADGQR